MTILGSKIRVKPALKESDENWGTDKLKAEDTVSTDIINFISALQLNFLKNLLSETKMPCLH